MTTAGTNPVQLTVTLDGSKVIEYSDSSSSRLSSGLKVGIFDFNGSGQPIENFTVAEGPKESDSFSSGSALGAQWTIATGSFTVASSDAQTTAANSYAYTGPEELVNTTASIEWNSATLVQAKSGVLVRSANGMHYAGGIDGSGFLAIYRREANGTDTLLASGAEFPTSGVHALSLTAVGTAPVQLSLKIDGIEWAQFSDSSSSRIAWGGRAGIFSSGTGQRFGRFDLYGDLPVPVVAMPPELAEIPPQTAAVGTLKWIFLQAKDLNGGDLTFTGSNLPAGSSLKSINVTLPLLGGGTRKLNFGLFLWTPGSTQTGAFTPTFVVTDNTSRADSQQVTITVPSSCAPIRHFLTASPEPTPDPSKTFYVHAGIGSDSNLGTSRTAPLQHIKKAICKVLGGTPCGGITGTGPGSSVVILRNTAANIPYEESLYFENLHGTASAPIWIGGEPGEPPLIADFQDPGDLNDSNEVMQFVRPEYLVFHDMIIGRDVGHTRSHGINLEDDGDYDNPEAAHHVIIRNVWFKNIGDGHGRLNDGEYSAVQSCIKSSGLNDFWFLGNAFNFCGRGTSDPEDEEEYPDQVGRNGYGVNADGCHDGVIAGNNFTGRTFTLTKGGSRDIEIRQNTSTVSLRTGPDLETNDDNRMSYQLGGSMHTGRFRPSLQGTTGDAAESGIVDADDGTFYEARHIRLIGNVIRGGVGIRIEGCYQCLVANNTVIDPVQELFFVTQPSGSLSALQEWDDEGRARYVSKGRIYNNIFYFSSSVKKVRLDSHLKSTSGLWSSFEFEGNLYCNSSNKNTCQPDAVAMDTGPGGALPFIDEEMEGLSSSSPTSCAAIISGCPTNVSCDPKFSSTETFALDACSPANSTGVSITQSSSQSPPTVLQYAGYVPPAGGSVAVEDRDGACYDATAPSRGALEVP